jgi:hypothetical protein
MTKMVRVTDGLYRGAKVEGEFPLAADFKASAGDAETRRFGRGGAGFIKIKHGGALVKCQNEVARVTVAGEGIGYEVLDVDAPEQPAAEAEVTEDAGEAPAEKSAVEQLLDAVFADDVDEAVVEVQAVDAADEGTVLEVVESTPATAETLLEQIAARRAELEG